MARKALRPRFGELREQVPARGLNAEIAGRPLRDHAKIVLGIAREGLVRRARLNSSGSDESIFLAPLEETVASGLTPAERLLAKYEGPWMGDIRRLFDEYAY